MNRLPVEEENAPATGNEAIPSKLNSGSLARSKKSPKIQVIWEQEDSADAANRLLKAFEMLLTDFPFERSKQPAQTTHFDKNH